MRRTVIWLMALLLTVSSVWAEDVSVILRWSESKGAMRFVFESDKGTIKNARVFHSLDLIKIEFDSRFDLSVEKRPPGVEVKQKGKNLFLKITGLKDIKVFRLDGPDRLVVDLIVEDRGTEQKEPEEKEPDNTVSSAVIVIDPGHGGYNVGLSGNEYKEKDITLDIASSVRHKARQSGGQVFLTRYNDRYVSIDERISNAFKQSPSLFLSLHLSSSPDFVIYYADLDSDAQRSSKYDLRYVQRGHVTKSSKFAKHMADVLSEKFNRKVRIRRADLPILSSVNASAILVELPDGRYFNYNSANRYSVINALLEGIGR